MFNRLAILLSASLLLSGCAPSTPIPVQSEATQTQAPADMSGNDVRRPSPTSNVDVVVKDDHYNFLNSMATTCIYAEGVGVTETVTTEGVLDGTLVMLPRSEAIDGSYTAGWIPANGNPAEVIFEKDVFDSCAIANMEALAKEAGKDLRKTVRVKYDAATDAYTATVDFSGFTRTAKYQMGEGGIAYSVTGTETNGQEVVTAMKFGMPKPEYVAALTAAIANLSSN